MEFLKTLSGDEGSAYFKYMKNVVYKVPSAKVLKNTMDVMEDIFSDESFVKDRDAKGDLYEYLLSKLSTSGTNGQFRTPKHIINMMVELMKPTPLGLFLRSITGLEGRAIEKEFCALISGKDFTGVQIELIDYIKKHYVENGVFYKS